MRVSTNTIFEAGVSAINRQQTSLLEIQQQVATGRRVVTPSDDPIAAARALQVDQAAAINEQYGVNRSSARTVLGLVEAGVGQAGDIVQNVRQRIIEAGNGAYSILEMRTIAADIRSLKQQLIGVANSTDGEGHYLFSGYQGNVRPFNESPTGVQYSGDDGQRLIQVSASRQMPISESGAETFVRVRQGNGTFVVSADAANTGSGTHDLGSVRDASLLTGDDYRVDFTVTGTVPNTITTFDVVNVTTATTILSAQPYVEGGAIQFDGMQIVIDGEPANGDRFDIVPSTNQSVFATLDALATLLESTPDNAVGRTQRTNGLTEALGNIDQSLDQFLLTRAGVGARLREVDDLQSVGEDLGLQYQQTLSGLRDLDYARAISDLGRQQAILEAAQQSFLRISQLSLFNYL